MTELDFAVVDVAVEPFAVTPRLLAKVAITASDDTPVHTVALRAQVRIEPGRRAYTDEEAAGLVDLFGPRERWADTQRTFLWQHTSAMVQGFTGSCEVALPLECSYDFEVAASKYLHALRDGAVPLQFLFSGTVFLAGGRGFVVAQVPWDRESSYRMPVEVWRSLMAQHYPGAGWVRLRHDVVEELARYRSAHGLLSFDEAVEKLLANW